MQYQACISTKGASANTKGGLIHGMSYGNTAITPRTLIASLSQVKAQYDQGVGQLTGKRQHSPLVITKQTDSASPLLFNAHWSQEVLQSVVIKLVGRPSSGGGEKVSYTINLTNAQISKVNRYIAPPTPKRPGNSQEQVNSNELEEVSFTFQKITYTNVAGSTSASDDWNWNP
jgi:type VI secretion system secreted protein Hcp